MLAPDPKRRASFDLILFHPWMKSVPSIFVSSASITSETSKHPYTMSLTSPLPDHNYLAVSSNHHQLSPDFNTIETYSSIHRTPSATSPKTKSVMRNVLSSAASGVRSIFRYLTEGPNPPPKSGYADGKARRSAPYPPTSPRRAERAERVLRPGVGGDGVPIVDGDWRRNLMNDIVQSSVVKGKDNSDVS
ncbi:hypothetical protein BC937DRAFT_89458 [Endogone sp. FLAS-F59071]|nr:hypothetical protein BC937DRAFT_89458 [Endogone sp. FLAS-F59071]|eukprot:RUS22383.1 hypothetical protein BC937DRAFT_89458 [Endogone sp. FLAS-F59071]